jgi:hypothetical protein
MGNPHDESSGDDANGKENQDDRKMSAKQTDDKEDEDEGEDTYGDEDDDDGDNPYGFLDVFTTGPNHEEHRHRYPRADTILWDPAERVGYDDDDDDDD